MHSLCDPLIVSFRLTPLGSFAVRNVCEAIAHIAGQTFVCAVLGADSQSRDSDIYDTKKDVCEEEERCAVVEVGQSMGGRAVELVDLLERVCTSVFV
jgi:hypothetical protein